LLVPLLLSAACLSVPDLGPRPEPRAPESFAATFDAPATGWPADRWWESYGDPQLATLIGEGLAGSPTMAIAEARVRRAQANAQQAGAALQPSIDATASGGALQVSENLGLPVGQGWEDYGQVAVGMTFDLDLWGRNRANLRAALSETDAARADAAYARLTLSTAIAASYADLARLAALRDTANTNLRIREDTLRMMREREAQGLENRAVVARAESNRAAAAAELAAVDEQIELIRNAIAALAGQGPDRGRAISLPAAARLNAFGLPSGLGVDIVGRRPDIVAARLRAEATRLCDSTRAEFCSNRPVGAGQLAVAGDRQPAQGGSSSARPAPVSLPIFSGSQSRKLSRSAGQLRRRRRPCPRRLITALRGKCERRARQRPWYPPRRAAPDPEASATVIACSSPLSRGLTIMQSAEAGQQQFRPPCREAGSRKRLRARRALVRALGGGFHSEEKSS
jgi:NodT family efflux transporter outer membrane factor (OMF) lipoprotein